MPDPGIIGVSLPQVLIANAASPSIWGDCPGYALAQDGRGFYFDQDFAGIPLSGTLTIGTASTAGVPGITYDADTSSTFALDGSLSTVLDMATVNTSGKAVAVLTRPYGAIAAASGRKFWTEASFALGSPGNEGLFFGLSALSGLVRGIVGTPSTSTVITPANTASFIGFGSRMALSVVTDFDVIYASGTGSPVSVATKVLNSSAFNAYNNNSPNGGNWFPGGILNYPTAPGNLAANTFVNLGIRYDGQQYLYFYVNGVVVAKQVVDSTIDQSSNYGVIFSTMANANTAFTTKLNFFRSAYQYLG